MATIELISPSANFMAILEPSKHILDPHAGLVVTEKAKVVQFVNGRSSVPAEWMPLLEAHSSFAGSATAPKMIYLAEEATSTTGPEGPQVIRGAISAAARKPVAAPFEGWDTAPAKLVIQRLGEVKNLRGAFLWESEHRMRATVLMALTKEITKAGPPEEEGDAPVVEELPDVMGAPAPDEED